MSDTTQYPDGPYLVNNDKGFYAAGVLCTDAGQNRYLPGIGTLNGLLGEGCTLTPLVPSTELESARQRIAALEAEVKRLRAEPTLDEMLQDLRHRYGSYVHLSANYNSHWWVAWGVGPQNRTGYYLVPSEAIRAAWEAVCKEEA